MKDQTNPCRVMQLLVMSACLLFSLGDWVRGQATSGGRSPRATEPDIIVIMADDLGWADVGYHGAEIKTPAIDRLATDGVRLEHYYATPTCTPTRVGLMTGRYPSRYGILSPAYGEVMDDRTVTLPAMLRERGYSTAITGKWHLGSPPKFTPTRYGFDSSYGYFDGQVDPFTHIYKNGKTSWHRNDQYAEEPGHATDLITREAVRVIESSSEDRPYFLYVAYSVPHHPLEEPVEWTERYPDVSNMSRRWYAASVSHMDDGIRQILEAVQRKGRLNQTVILFLSDNGGQKSWHSTTEYKGKYADRPHDVLGNNTPLRGWKGDTYEGGIRVPGVVYAPRRLKAGRSDAPIHVVDWLPTLCHLAGCETSQELDGMNMWEAIRTHQASGSPDRTMYWKTPKATALRLGDWKLVVGESSNGPELFDLQNDPLEERNLARNRPQQLARLTAAMAETAKKDRSRK